MCAFVGDHTFHVHHVTHDGIFACDTHAAQHLSRITCDVGCYLTTIALCHGHLLGCGFTVSHEGTEPPVEQLRFGDLGDHFSEFLLLQLKSTNGPVELYALHAVAQSRIITIHRCTYTT